MPEEQLDLIRGAMQRVIDAGNRDSGVEVRLGERLEEIANAIITLASMIDSLELDVSAVQYRLEADSV